MLKNVSTQGKLLETRCCEQMQKCNTLFKSYIDSLNSCEQMQECNTLFKSYIDSLNNALCNVDDTNQPYSAYQKERNNLTRLSFEEHEKSYKTFMYSKDDKKLWEKMN